MAEFGLQDPDVGTLQREWVLRCWGRRSIKDQQLSPSHSAPPPPHFPKMDPESHSIRLSKTETRESDKATESQHGRETDGYDGERAKERERERRKESRDKERYVCNSHREKEGPWQETETS